MIRRCLQRLSQQAGTPWSPVDTDHAARNLKMEREGLPKSSTAGQVEGVNSSTLVDSSMNERPKDTRALLNLLNEKDFFDFSTLSAPGKASFHIERPSKEALSLKNRRQSADKLGSLVGMDVRSRLLALKSTRDQLNCPVLAAPAIGWWARCFLIDGALCRELARGVPCVLVADPLVTWRSPEKVSTWETCPTLPGLAVRTARQQSLSFSFWSGEPCNDMHALQVRPALAIACQRALDHFEGKYIVHRQVGENAVIPLSEYVARKEYYDEEVDIPGVLPANPLG